ncbi:brachyurin-like [Culex pipiens pallens]|uniref:brachyurin-like n=1 Tax=Culex pipiens pallens TaxID=42434 RepID=UPI001953952A|nr:brachyurin-like [Culex pipiens pallens]
MRSICLLIATLAIASSATVRDIYNIRSVDELEFTPDGRVVNGAEARPGQFPYQALVLSYYEDGSGLCGGSLLTVNYVLTAAHCVELETLATHGTVILGAHNRREEESSQQRIDFATINVHPGWDLNVIQYDVATIELATPAEFNEYVQPIELPALSDQRTFSGIQATISGFGRTNDIPGSPASDVVMFTRNPILTNANCRSILDPFPILAQHVCLSGAGGRGACHGDSGGPLTVQDEGASLQIGIASFVIGGICSVGVPIGFVRVTYFLDWIADNSDVVLRS